MEIAGVNELASSSGLMWEERGPIHVHMHVLFSHKKAGVNHWIYSQSMCYLCNCMINVNYSDL